ncbi:hypothetical protein [Bacillus thuringiensis]|uniref:hypothetical protein n=1 Tax=Bacillus thuringiensis TaxID=1428 RepID=UPI0001A1FB28|nr:hypothetical protein [Bacillus thuringiensis]EEM80215.1 hypothetical protein bthur0011_58390 [Bacillus thuringiensis serovar huazhongensis BGSC 4BD1]
MYRPYIAKYVEEQTLQNSTNLVYDDITQISFINKEKNVKKINLGPDTTIVTETIENADPDEYFLDPDTTIHTFTVENNDTDEHYCGPETTRITKTLENIDPDEYYS